MTGTKWKEVRENRITNKSLREKLDNIDSFDEMYASRCFNWLEKLAEMPATASQTPGSHASYLVHGVLVANVYAVAPAKLPVEPTST